MHRTTGGFELVFSPLILALLGYGLDRLFGTVPVFTVVFAVVGLAGAVAKLFFTYRFEMEQHEANGPWAK
ncbi:MAG TPA: AtpZ/AtpI family protein [Acidimicrobiales bacterium]